MAGEGIGDALGCLFAVAVMGVTLTIVFSVYYIYDSFRVKTYESKAIIQPEIKLETDGKKIDTLYVYKFK